MKVHQFVVPFLSFGDNSGSAHSFPVLSQVRLNQLNLLLSEVVIFSCFLFIMNICDYFLFVRKYLKVYTALRTRNDPNVPTLLFLLNVGVNRLTEVKQSVVPFYSFPISLVA